MFLLSFFALINLVSSKPRRVRLHKELTDFTTACDLCVTINNNLIRYLSYHYSDDEIQTTLLNNCAVFDGKAKVVCDYLADTYFPVFLYLARSKVPAKTSCIKMGYCSDLE